jgi:aspartate/methionine/tyrosine aminotransferase
VGYACFHDPKGSLAKIKEGFMKLARLRLCGCTPVQRACIAALKGPQEHLKETRRKLKERRDFAFRRLNEIEGISCTRPDGAFYVFPKIDLSVGGWKNDFEFAMDFLNTKGVVVVNGSGFSEEFGKNHFRSVILPQVEVLDEAFGLLDEFMSGRKKS